MKIAAALVFASIVKDSSVAGDYAINNRIGIQEYEILKTNPKSFFTDFGQNNNTEIGQLFSAENSFWDDLAGNIVARSLALVNFFTQGNFYLNSILFSLIGFLASIGLYRVALMHSFSKLAALICSFFIVSCVAFTAAIHKDTIVFFALAMSIFHFCKLAHSQKITSAVYLILSLVLLFCMRNYVVICFLPAAIIYILSKRIGLKNAFLFVCGFLILSIFVIQYISPNKNLTTVLVTRQSQYLALNHGNSHLQLTPLKPKLMSVVASVPEAVAHVAFSPMMFRPYNLMVLLCTIETWIYLLVFVAGILIFIYKKQPINLQLAIFYSCLSIAAFIIIGLIVPNAGAIIRYRALFLPLFLLPFTEQINLYIKNRNI